MASIRKPPYRFRFKYPDGHISRGPVEDATDVQIHEGKNGDYATRIELLKFDDKEKKHIRFSYWRRPNETKAPDDWRWASQTTWTFDTELTWNAIREAERKGFFAGTS
jgi:hypothetical protein